MTLVEVREYDGLSELAPQTWEGLTARGPATLCGSREWLAAAFATTHQHATPFLLVAEVDDRPVGLLALAVHEPDTAPTLRFAGAPHNDLNDLLARSGFELQAATAVVEALAGVAARGLTLSLDDVDPRGHLAAVNAGALSWAPGEVAPVIDLRGAWAAAASARRRQQWNRRLRRLRDQHDVAFRCVRGPEMLRALPEFARLRNARLDATGREGDQPPVRFFEAVVGELVWTRGCALMEMLVDGRPVASDLYLLDRPVATMWLRALDPAWRRFPCGHLLLRSTALELAAEGYTSLDLGRGDEPYKYVFGAERRVLLRGRSR